MTRLMKKVPHGNAQYYEDRIINFRTGARDHVYARPTTATGNYSTGHDRGAHPLASSHFIQPGPARPGTALMQV